MKKLITTILIILSLLSAGCSSKWVQDGFLPENNNFPEAFEHDGDQGGEDR